MLPASMMTYVPQNRNPVRVSYVRPLGSVIFVAIHTCVVVNLSRLSEVTWTLRQSRVGPIRLTCTTCLANIIVPNSSYTHHRMKQDRAVVYPLGEILARKEKWYLEIKFARQLHICHPC